MNGSAARETAGGTSLLRRFIRHGTLANILMLMMLVAGLWAFPRLNAQFFPDVVIERVTVSVVWPGAGPEDVDSAIVQRIEPALLTVSGVESTSATATEGRALISAEFAPGTDMAEALDAVKAAVDGVRDLPEDADPPEINRVRWHDRVTDVVITGPVGRDLLARFADDLVARLHAAGVSRVETIGIADPAIVVELDAGRLIARDVSVAEVAAGLARASGSQPAGAVAGGGARVRVGEERRRAEAISRTVVRRTPDGAAVTVGELGRVRAEGVGRKEALFVGEMPAVALRVSRGAGEDAIELLEKVRRITAEMATRLPEGVEMRLVRQRADLIRQRLDLLIDNAAVGLVFVLLLLFLFLDARTAFWVAMGIPVSLAAAVAIMYLAGLSLNMISLFALIITLGMVVDDAIVVGEHADYRARRLGESPLRAAEKAVRRMAAPVFAATATTVIAFAALAVISGRFGQLVKDIPLTVAAVLIASLLECFLVLPRHMAVSLAESGGRKRWLDMPSRLFDRGFVWTLAHLVRPLAGWTIRLRYPVLAGAIFLLALSVAAILRGDVPWRFFNAPELGSVRASFTMLEGAGRADSLAMMRELQRAADRVAARYALKYGRDPVTFVLASVGGGTRDGDIDPDLTGAIDIELIDADKRPYSSFRFLADLKREVKRHPLLDTLGFRSFRSGPGGAAIDVALSGADARTLKAAAEALKARLADFPEVSALEDTLPWGKPEMLVRLTARGEALGLAGDQLGRRLRERLEGITAARIPEGRRTVSLKVAFRPEDRAADLIDSGWIRIGPGRWVPLADVVEVTTREGFAVVRRENGVRVVTVSGDLAEDDPARAAEVMATLKERILPAIESRFGVEWQLGGLAEQERRFLSDALTGFLLGLVGIYLVLAAVFASWSRPAVVMSVIPFGLVGALWGHWWWDVPLSMFSVVGLIGMSGIIINDSIVLVTAIDQRARTRALGHAIVDAVVERFRPVLLTTLTTVLGLAPLLYEQSRQAQFLKPTIITLVYGLGFGLLLVLVVVPALVRIGRDIGAAIRAFRRALRAGRRRRALLPRILLGLSGILGIGLIGGLTLVMAGGSAVPAPLLAALPSPLAALPPPLVVLALFTFAGLGGAALFWLMLFVVRGVRARSRPRRSAG